MDPYVGEIRLFAGTFAPIDWLFCYGQSLNASEYDMLYSLIGYTYGGSQNTFNAPDFRGRIPVNIGQGEGLSGYYLGQYGGSETVSLTTDDLPAHKHRFAAETTGSTTNGPEGHIIGNYLNEPVINYYKAEPSSADYVYMNNASISYTGGSQPHTNMQPFLSLSFIICHTGIWPNRT